MNNTKSPILDDLLEVLLKQILHLLSRVKELEIELKLLKSIMPPDTDNLAGDEELEEDW